MKISKLRTSLGFGVHSPFAYDFIKNVLREKYSYYSYRELRKFLKEISAKKDTSFVLTLFRIMIYFETSLLTSISEKCKWQQKLEKVISDNLNGKTKESENIPVYLLNENPEVLTEEFLGASLEGEFVLVADLRKLNGAVTRRLEDKLNGIAYGERFLCEKKYMVAVALKYLPMQKYILRF